MRTSMLMLAALCTTLAACRDDDPIRPAAPGPVVLARTAKAPLGGTAAGGLQGCLQMHAPAGQSLSIPGAHVLSTVVISAMMPGLPDGLFNNFNMRLPNPRPCGGTQGREGETLTWEILPVAEISADTAAVPAPPGVDQLVWDALGPRMQRVLNQLAIKLKADCMCETSVGYILNELSSTWLSNKQFGIN